MDVRERLDYPTYPDFVALLRHRAEQQPDCDALAFLVDGETTIVRQTYRQLDVQARALAVQLQESGLAGQRALLLLPPGFDFVVALLGCFYAGVTAVPVYLPKSNRPLTGLLAIVADAHIRAVLTTAALLPDLMARINREATWENVCWLTTDAIDVARADRWQPPVLGPDALACLQYTSGSTATPKGVMLSHGNLLSNSRIIGRAFGHKPSSVGLIWLPPYHDMGLIGGILQPLYSGFFTVLMSPVHVIQQPLRWLRAVARFRATTSGGPNFMYGLCVQRIRPEECEGLDLSCWEVAFNGAEPIREETLDRFTEKFAPFGFRREAFFPCYGLAEATLFVSGGPKHHAPTVRPLPSSEELPVGDAPAPGAGLVVSCGRPADGQEVAVVDPQSGCQCPADRVGEVWVAGPSVSHGYWGRPEETERTFGATIREHGDRRWLRTGDLGFLSDDQLFVTGRLKDLMIIDGRNHYPQDIELTAERSHPALRAHGGAAFTLDTADRQLVIVHEVERSGLRTDQEEVFRAIRDAVAAEHELSVHAIALIKPASLPKTTSGKIQRTRSRQLFLSGALELVGLWHCEVEGESQAAWLGAACRAAASSPALRAPALSGDRGELARWLTAQIAHRSGRPEHAIDLREPFANYGLTSRDAVELSGELEQRLARRLSPTLIYDYPTPEALCRFLVGGAPAEALPVAGSSATAGEPIAVVGIGCRLPGANGPAAFWELLARGGDAIGTVPEGRWNAETVRRQAGTEAQFQRMSLGGWLKGIDRFDPAFFGIAPREAACIDPQHRLLLETAWEALEDAGIPAHRLRGSATGVFVGISTNDYRRQFFSRTHDLDPYWSTGNAGCIAANRVSYTFDFKGPSVAVDTACSSSLVAVHLACQSLRQGECDVALAGGVNAILTPDISFSFLKGGGLASDGRCKAFDARGDGIVRSEGAGLLVLKRLSQAQADGDRILCVVRGSAVNQDGRSNGITAPNQAAQEDVLRRAWREAGLTPSAAQLIECHGAGTLLGDVIEANALHAVLSGEGSPRRCILGSVKTNIGHCEAAAGVAGLIKVALAMQHGQVPPHLHFTAPNPHIRFSEMPFDIPRELMPWEAENGRRLAGVSAFGFGGTNAHVVVESAPDAPISATAADKPPEAWLHLLVLSAATPAALAALAGRWNVFLAASPPTDAELRALCTAAAVQRSHLDHRAALRFHTLADLQERLAALAAGQTHPDVVVHQAAGKSQGPVFVFSGHGGQWRGMHRALWERFPAFRDALERCDALIRSVAGWSVLEEIQAEGDRWRLEGGNVERVQTALFAFQVALAELWKSWGVVPSAVVGHSMGEIAAAYVSGALDLPAAVRVVVERSRFLQRALEETGTATGMAALRLSADEVEPLLAPYEGQVFVAVHNSPKYTVVAGPQEVLQRFIRDLRARKIGGLMMNVPGAAHTPALQEGSQQLRAALDGLVTNPSGIAFYSTLAVEQVPGDRLDAGYWAGSVCRPVQFAPTVSLLAEEGHRLFVEVGPHPLLMAAVVQCLEDRGHPATVLPTVRREEADLDAFFESLGTLHALGQEIDWRQLGPVSRLPLPQYPWQHERCWIDIDTALAQDGSGVGHPLLGTRIELAARPELHLWDGRIDRARLNRSFGYAASSVQEIPLALAIEATLSAAREVLGCPAVAIEQTDASASQEIASGGALQVQILGDASASPAACTVYVRQAGVSTSAPWRVWFACRIQPLDDSAPRCSLAELQREVGYSVDGEPGQRVIRRVGEQGETLLLAQTVWPELAVAEPWLIAPAGLDGWLKMLAPMGPAEGRMWEVAAVGAVRWHDRPCAGQPVWLGGRITAGTAACVEGDIAVWNLQGDLLVEVSRVRLQSRQVSWPVEASPSGQPAAGKEGASGADMAAALARFRSAEPADREQRLREYLLVQIAHTLGTMPGKIDVQQPLTHLGIDSLMATEIKNRVELELAVELPMIRFLEGPTVSRLARALLQQLDDPIVREPASVSPPSASGIDESADPEASRLLAELDDLSDEDVDALMRRMLKENKAATHEHDTGSLGTVG